VYILSRIESWYSVRLQHGKNVKTSVSVRDEAQRLVDLLGPETRGSSLLESERRLQLDADHRMKADIWRYTFLLSRQGPSVLGDPVRVGTHRGNKRSRRNAAATRSLIAGSSRFRTGGEASSVNFLQGVIT
jgi:hypothetical protein